MDAEQRFTSVIKTIILSFLILILATFFFAYKVEACKSSPQNCYDKFMAFDNNNNTNPDCPVGATMEVVKEPKAGTICHCAQSVPDASAK